VVSEKISSKKFWQVIGKETAENRCAVVDGIFISLQDKE